MANEENNGNEQESHKVNPIQVQKYLSGLDYPCTKQQIIEHAKSQGADDNVIETLSGIEDREYNGPNAVSEAIGEEE